MAFPTKSKECHVTVAAQLRLRQMIYMITMWVQGWCVVSLCVCAMYHCASWESAQWGDFPADIETPLTSARCSRAPHMQRNIRMRRLVMCRDVAMSPCLLLGHMLYLLLVYVVSSFECHR